MTDYPESETFKLATSTSHLLHRAQQLAADRFAQLVGDAVTLRQFAVLVAISEKPGLSQSDLVRVTGIDRSTLAEMMSRLEKRALIQRTASASDARAYSVRLSGSGAAILAGATQHARAADAAVLDLLPRTKARTFLATLSKLSALAEKAEAKAAEKEEREAKRRAKHEARKREKAKSRKRKNDAPTGNRRQRV